MREFHLTIPIEPKTKKNSQQIIICKGRPMIIPSKKYKEFEKESGLYLAGNDIKIDFPVNIKCVYYMSTKRRVDLSNLLNATLDILCFYDIIDDDNRNIVYSVNGSVVLYDKQNPRTEITITEIEGDIEIWGKS